MPQLTLKLNNDLSALLFCVLVGHIFSGMMLLVLHYQCLQKSHFTNPKGFSEDTFVED